MNGSVSVITLVVGRGRVVACWFLVWARGGRGCGLGMEEWCTFRRWSGHSGCQDENSLSARESTLLGHEVLDCFIQGLIRLHAELSDHPWGDRKHDKSQLVDFQFVNGSPDDQLVITPRPRHQ